MKHLLYLFIGVVLLSCNNSTKTNVIQLVTVQEAEELIEMESVQLIDTRSPEEFQIGHIEGALNIPLTAANFDAEIAKLDTQQPVLVYCKSGGRSAKCAIKLQEAGFIKINDLDGGLTAWQQSQNPVMK